MHRRLGSINSFYLVLGATLCLLAFLTFLLVRLNDQGRHVATGPAEALSDALFLYCAAGIQAPVEKIVADYLDRYHVPVRVQYGGSATLLSQAEVSRTGDLFLAADEGYADLAHDKGLVAERIPVASMRAVLTVRKGNPKAIHRIDDLLRADVRAALANPGQAAIGQAAREALEAAGKWKALEEHVTATGVFKPTVSDVANDVKLGSVDAGIVWDSTVAQHPELEAVRIEELDRATAHITITVLRSSKTPTAALKFARFLAARDRGLQHFAELGYQPVDGDPWQETPEITFFAGSVNRRALEPIIRQFQQREGVVVNTVYNGCGILTAQMRTMRQAQGGGFPDVYMACDVYYLDTVKDLFQDGVNVSNTDIVIVTQAGNPKQIAGLEDLARPGMRVAVGQPEQCTIGVLSRRLLEGTGLWDKVRPNIVTETATSALLVPQVTTGAADAVLAYATDTLAEAGRLHVIPIDSPLAVAIQPFSIARSSQFKYLGRRLFDTIARSPEAFTSAGFRWRLPPDGQDPWPEEGHNRPGDIPAKPPQQESKSP
ncbi:MAG: molybdate ABC transporter substrate-binding protein [Thermoguttaceae bacterium]